MTSALPVRLRVALACAAAAIVLLSATMATAQPADFERHHSLCLPTGPAPIGGYDVYDGPVRTRGTVVIGGVPGYEWFRGCGPTAAAMVVGYWDMHGFRRLIPGWSAGQSQAVNDMCATDAHYNDYSLPEDNATTGLLPDASFHGNAHASNCVADFMRTSWYTEGNFWGWSRLEHVDDAFYWYTDWVNATYVADYTCETWNIEFCDFPWAAFRAEIDAGCPMVLLVDSSGDGETDHFVTAIGYRDINGYPEYACLDTWAPASRVRWERFRGLAPGQAWGILGITLVHMSGTELPDCNDNGVADEVDILQGTSTDCDGNGVPDDCDLVVNPPVAEQAASTAYVLAQDFADAGYPQISMKQWDDFTLAEARALGAGTAHFYPPTWGGYATVPFLVEIADAPGGAEAGANVVLSTTGSGVSGLISWDFGGATLSAGTYWLSVQATGGFISFGMVNWYRANLYEPNGSQHYTHNPGGGYGHGTDPAPGATWYNNVAADLAFTQYTVHDPDCNANGVLDVCDIAAGTSPDANGNGIPDECETPTVCAGDGNCDGTISWRDIDYFVAAMNDNVAAWEALFAPGTPACPFANNDVNGDGTVSWRDIDPLVGVMNMACP